MSRGSMQKIYLIITIALMLQACTVLNFLPTQPPTNSPIPTATVTRTPTRTLTPTRTITPTPPYTATLISVATFTPFVLGNASGDMLDVEPTTVFTPTSAVPLGGFESITITNGRIYYGICKPNYTKFVVKVENPDEITKVYLFFRLENSKKLGDTSPWTGTVTDNDGAGFFLYTLRANNIPERKNHLKSYVHYQLVAENKDQEIIGRTHIYTRNIILEACK